MTKVSSSGLVRITSAERTALVKGDTVTGPMKERGINPGVLSTLWSGLSATI
jgi:hypothetical protein